MCALSMPTPGPSERQRAHAAAVAWARATLANPQALFVDTETTGLGDTDEVIDIAIVDTTGAALFESLVRPSRPIPLDAMRVHGINDAMVAHAPTWDVVYPQVAQLLAGRVIVVYNADFDRRLINQMNTRHGFLPFGGGWECAMKRYGEWVGDWNARYGNYRWHRLDGALQAFGHPTASHRALDDARSCHLVVRGMARD